LFFGSFPAINYYTQTTESQSDFSSFLPLKYPFFEEKENFFLVNQEENKFKIKV